MKDICIISTDFHANTNAYWRKKTLESVQQMKDSDYFNHDASHIDGQENIIDFRDLKECTIKKINLPKLLEHCRRGSRRDLTYQKLNICDLTTIIMKSKSVNTLGIYDVA